GIGAGRQARRVCSAEAPVPQRRVPSLHTGATTMVRDRDFARYAALCPAWISSPGAVVGAGMRDDLGRLPEFFRHRKVSRREPTSAEGMWDRPLQTGT